MMSIARRAWSALRIHPLIGSILASVVAASALVLPWVPVFRVLGAVQRHGHMGDVGPTGVWFFSGLQLIAYARGGTLPGEPRLPLSLVIIIDQLFPSAWLAALPGLLALLTLALAAWALAAHRPGVVIVLLRIVAAVALLLVACDAFIVYVNLTSNTSYMTPSSIAATSAAYGLMALAYIAVVLGAARAKSIAGFGSRVRLRSS